LSISDAAFYRWQEGALILSCHLQPRASRDEFAGEHDRRLKIRLTAPPVEGRANAHLIEFLAAQFAVPKKAVSIVSGDSARQKLVRIENPRQLPAGLSIAPPSASH